MNRLDIQTALHYEQVRERLVNMINNSIAEHNIYLMEEKLRLKQIERIKEIDHYEKLMAIHNKRMAEYPKEIINYMEYLEILNYYD